MRVALGGALGGALVIGGWLVSVVLVVLAIGDAVIVRGGSPVLGVAARAWGALLGLRRNAAKGGGSQSALLAPLGGVGSLTDHGDVRPGC